MREVRNKVLLSLYGLWGAGSGTIPACRFPVCRFTMGCVGLCPRGACSGGETIFGVHCQQLSCVSFSPCQTVVPTRPAVDSAQPCQRPLPASSAPLSIAPGGVSGPGPSPARASPVNRPAATTKSLSPVTSRSPGTALSAPPKPQSPAQNTGPPPDTSQDKLAEQIALVSVLLSQ